MYEKELYPAVEKFLKTKKNCLSEYVVRQGLYIKRFANVFKKSRSITLIMKTPP